MCLNQTSPFLPNAGQPNQCAGASEVKTLFSNFILTVTDASIELQISDAQCGETGRVWLCPRAGDLATALTMCDGDTHQV